MVDRSPIASLQWRRADRQAPGNRPALAEILTEMTLADCYGSVSGPASAENWLAGRSPTIVDALTARTSGTNLVAHQVFDKTPIPKFKINLLNLLQLE